MASSSTPSDPLNGAAAAASGPSPDDAQGFVSDLRAKDKVDELRARHGVPNEYTALLTDDLRANSPPPGGFICVYEAALEGRMRIPLDTFFCQVLSHFRIAPSQLTPNCWRMMAGFFALCHEAGAEPSSAVFLHFFSIVVHGNEWYLFRAKKNLRFTGFPHYIKDWKRGFFFLFSPTSWPCPVEWGEPPQTALKELALNPVENELAAELLRAHSATPVDLNIYLSYNKLTTVKISSAPLPSAMTIPSVPTTTHSKEMDSSVLDFMYTMVADTEVAQASEQVEKGKCVPAKKRRLNEASSKEVEGLHPTVVLNTSHAAHGCSSPAGMCSAPPLHFSNNNIDWKAAQELLQGLTGSQERLFAAKEPSDVLHLALWPRSRYAALNYVTFSLGYAVDVDKKLESAELDNAALREQLEKTKAELVESKREAEADREKAKAELVVWKRAAEEDREKAKVELATVKRSADEELQKEKAQLAAAQAELESSKAAEQRLRSEVRMLRRAERALEGTPQGGLHSARGAS
ncbi:uncharacterized protein [Triticum aestivum]|uniref:uncharacterized protein n=1 Tax=Triticum aestivum TaxID=4565 RepID=UPI001D032578|nr:uncharacterized protein LOC123153092 [Triticum aestivum]